MRLVALVCAAVCGCGAPSTWNVTVIDLPEIVAAPRVPSLLGRDVNPAQLRRFNKIADAPPLDSDTAEQIRLGRALWFDERLSKDGDLSCDSCHSLTQYGVDGLRVSIGHEGKLGRRNTPTVFNAINDRVQFWDGRAANLEAQVLGPLLNPDEMAMTEHELVTRTSADPELVRMFEQAYGERPSLANTAKAIAAFEHTLVTRGRWDQYLAGDESALTRDEIAGLRLFLSVGCIGCHTGPDVGASMYRVAGVVEPWPNQSDLGRFEITGNPADRMVFRVPSLRNVEKTGPYFHDGSVARLPDAVRLMARVQLGIHLSDGEVESLVTFLNALTGDVPEGIGPIGRAAHEKTAAR